MESFEISETLKAKLDQAESLEEIAKICAEEGLEVTAEELKELMAMQTSELNPEDLDNVAGGIVPLLVGPIVGGLTAIVVYLIKKKK